MAESHDQYRYRMCVWRQAHGPSLPRERTRVRPSQRNIRRATKTIFAAGGPGVRALGATTTGRPARPRGRERKTNRQYAAAWQCYNPRRKRHGSARSHEPVRSQPEMADLLTADNVAL